MDVNRKSGDKVFVVLSRTHTKIWKHSFEPGAVPILVVGIGPNLIHILLKKFLWNSKALITFIWLVAEREKQVLFIILQPI